MPLPMSNPPFTAEEVDVDELVSTMEDLPLGHLALFESVFGVGVSLARYIVDDPLWPILAAAGLLCSFCVHNFWKSMEIPANALNFPSSQSNGGPLPTRLSPVLAPLGLFLELSPLDDQDRLEEDCLELQDFVCCQPKLSTVVEPVPSGPRSPLVPDKAPSVPKKRKRTVRIGEASSSKPDRVDGLYQEVFSHSRFSSDEAFLTAAQHAGYVDARPGSLEPPLHCRLFFFGHPIPFPQSPLSNHIPAVPSMDSIMLDWERVIVGYVSELLGYPVPSVPVPVAVGVSDPSDAVVSTTPVILPDVSPVLSASAPTPTRTPLFLLESLSPPSPIPSSTSVPNVPPEIIDLTLEDDDALYESREEFLVCMGETSGVKRESTGPSVV
ncbi:hypothetical protein F5876DRAFT_70703 [Lentinula aff. lateritia]|uniref:Uncharacterized protein n=1 Tax=Lentinula aff. lateritia TaxID=2804960 RepID=A0ACC1TI33_9AGAR|nr:hypothetical protein F5876DRAFT_70703 [Lentinula aff. lateritia]